MNCKPKASPGRMLAALACSVLTISVLAFLAALILTGLGFWLFGVKQWVQDAVFWLLFPVAMWSSGLFVPCPWASAIDRFWFRRVAGMEI